MAGRPGSFFRIDLDGAAGHVDLPLHGVKNEEFGFRTEVGGVADAGGLQISLGALGDGARVAVIAFAVGWLDHVAGHHDGGFVEERVDVDGIGIRHQQHVGSLNAFPAGDGGTVESMAFFKLVGIEVGNRHAHVLFLTTGVGEA